MFQPHRTHRRPGAVRVALVLACALAGGAALAQTQTQNTPPAQISTPGNTGIDSSGRYDRERAACMTGATQQARDTCLREAENAAADKRKGQLGTAPPTDMRANALRRCEALGGEDHAACTARVLGYGNKSGSVAGGGVLREVETVVVPPGQSEVTIEPKTAEPVLVVPSPQK